MGVCHIINSPTFEIVNTFNQVITAIYGFLVGMFADGYLLL